jgi:predicted nucleic acid-binding protein
VIFDSGALIAVERGHPRMSALLATAREPIYLPTPVLAQVWRNGRRQVLLSRFLRQTSLRLDAFDVDRAKLVGVLLGESATSDVVDGAVVVCWQEHGGIVVTSDPGDLVAIDPAISSDIRPL